MRRQIRIGSGVDHLDPRIEQVGRFSLTVSLAETFGRDRGFLVGDAAHRVTPRGGTGMNMAMQGAFNLGWKLAWVLNGWAGPGLLDSYESERRPIVRHNIARSVDPAGSTREAATALQVDLGGRIPHVRAERAGGRRSVLDLLGDGLTLFTGDPGSWAAAAAVKEGPPVAVEGLDPLAARGLGAPDGSALLVRPDGGVAAWVRAGEDPVLALRAAVPDRRSEWHSLNATSA